MKSYALQMLVEEYIVRQKPEKDANKGPCVVYCLEALVRKLKERTELKRYGDDFLSFYWKSKNKDHLAADVVSIEKMNERLKALGK